ncbi:MAG TPA: helix-turn-helix transcriptional regulator, partial [Reyranella sp.]|nr:helix-turn-helix transcriptional regulator [Reyranella sp.]
QNPVLQGAFGDSFLFHSLSPQASEEGAIPRDAKGAIFHGARQVAKRLSKPQSFVAKYERGERRLSAIEFIHVARALGVEPVALLRQVIDIVDRGEC